VTGPVSVNAPGLAPPAPPTSHAVRAGGLLVVSGQVPRQPDGGVPDALAAQVELALRNLSTVLAAGGYSLDDVILLRTYVTDAEALAAFRELRTPWFPVGRPAATTVVVSALADERWRIEIEAIAWRES
jgi:enamine deaminase RidA (YjgF/YER057c/UK114 family)